MIQGILTSEYKNLYNRENIFVSEEGGGAGNNWAQGYTAGERTYEEVMDMVEREAEGSDSLEVCMRLVSFTSPSTVEEPLGILIGLYGYAFYSGRHWLWPGVILA